MDAFIEITVGAPEAALEKTIEFADFRLQRAVGVQPRPSLQLCLELVQGNARLALQIFCGVSGG
jgi:hypothetical protein